MSYPSIFQTCTASAAVTSLLGSLPTRLYPFGEAPHSPTLPYAVWQTISGSPENYLNQRPDIDSYSLQVDVYADSIADARAVAEALRDAIEPVAYIVSWNGESTDSETNHKRIGFTVDWWVQRV